MEARDTVLSVLKVYQLISHAFFDEDAASVLVHNRLLILRQELVGILLLANDGQHSR